MANKKSTKNMYIYSAYDLKGNLVCEGTLNFLADMLGTDTNNICMDSVSGSILYGEFKITRRLNSLVGNSYMTMLKDIELNGTDAVLDKAVSSLENLIEQIKYYKETKKADKLLDNVILSDISIDELRLLLNITYDMGITDREFKDLKRDYLKPLAVELDKVIGGSENG